MRLLWLGAVALPLATLAHAQAPAINPGGIVNAASGATQGIAPGSMVSIFGTNLAGAATATTKIPVATTLGDVVSVTFNNVAAPLFYVSPLQINAQVPWNVLASGTSGTASVVVVRSTGTSAAQNVQVVPAMPGIFTVNQSGTGQAIATDNTDANLAAPEAIAGFPLAAHPVNIGDYLIIWCTGLGAVMPTIASGEAASNGVYRNTELKPVVTIGGIPATFVYAVLSPQFVGLYQLAVQVAQGTPTGDAEALQIQVNGVTTAAGVTIAVTNIANSPFNTLTPAISVFTPSTDNLPNLPSVTFPDGGAALPSTGYQGGDLVNGKVLYYPWQAQSGTGGGNIGEAIISGIPQGVVMSYNASTSGFTAASSWTFFDMSTLDSGAKGFNAAAVAGTTVYMVPAGHHNGALPTFVRYDATKAVNDASAYQFVDAPQRGGVLGDKYGWCEGIFDGTYAYYVPDLDEILGASGNIVRYDTTKPFSLSGGGWEAFDMSAVNASATAYQSAIYDGHRFIYYIPFRNQLIVRYDTQYGTPGTANPAAFTNPAAYTILNPTQLGTGNNPQVSGTGSASNLAGFTGAATVWDTAHQNEYLYLVPWATYPAGAQTPHVQTTVARVRIGSQSGSTWNEVDITASGSNTNTLISATPNWEIFDLTNLTTNPQWAKNGWPQPATYPSGPLTGESMIGGFQGNWINTASSSPRVGFIADFSQFWVEHDVSHALADPTGWYVAKVPSDHRNGTFGGAYDAAHQILYPAPPAVPLIQASGL